MTPQGHEKLLRIIEESIRIEFNVAELYMDFFKLFPEDRKLWWKLSLEEDNHASLLKTCRDIFLPIGKFPAELLPPVLEPVRVANNKIQSIIKHSHKKQVTRERSFQIALEIEIVAGENQFQLSMDKPPGSKILDIFRAINREEKDQHKRIQIYAEKYLNNDSLLE